MSDIAIAVVLAAAILVASTVSIEVGISVALIELALGVVVGNAFHVSIPDWLSFVGSFAGIVLTFLAGAEVDVPQFKREWRASLILGGVSFAGPFAVAGLAAYYALGWNHRQAEIAGIALSTTSLAIVYADRPRYASVFPPPVGNQSKSATALSSPIRSTWSSLVMPGRFSRMKAN